MADERSQDASLTDSLAAAQLEKLLIEIQNLKKKNKWDNIVASYTPLISVLIAVGGFLFGIYQFQKQQRIYQNQMINEQQKDRLTEEVSQKIKIQDQIRTDIEQLLQFTTDKNQTVSKALFLLEDLRTILKTDLPGESGRPDAFLAEKRQVTVTLIYMIQSDCDFDQQRDVQFALTVISEWSDYQQYLKENPNTLAYLLRKHTDALEHLYDSAPLFFSQVERRAGAFAYPARGMATLSTQITHFERLFLSFKRHWDLLEEQSQLSTDYLGKFQAAICNSTFTRQEFGMNLVPSLKHGEFAHCLQKARR
jgi:hypothetical protein